MNSILLALALSCPAITGHLIIQDYAGPVTIDLCVGSFGVSGPNMYLTLYDPTVDGVFKNGFD